MTDVEPDLGPRLSKTIPKIPGTVPTNGHATIPNDSGPISACFGDDPKLLNCEIAIHNEFKHMSNNGKNVRLPTLIVLHKARPTRQEQLSSKAIADLMMRLIFKMLTATSLPPVL